MTAPRVGIGSIVRKNGKVLVGRRKSPLGRGQYVFPGGKLEFGESWKNCAFRETLEETGCVVKPVNLDLWKEEAFITNNVMQGPLDADNKPTTVHYVTIYMLADWVAGEPEAKEPEKQEGWKWCNTLDMVKLLQPESKRYLRKYLIYNHVKPHEVPKEFPEEFHWLPVHKMIELAKPLELEETLFADILDVLHPSSYVGG